MSEHCPHIDAQKGAAPRVRGGLCDRFLIALVVLPLVHAGAAWAADPTALPIPTTSDENLRPSISLSASPFAGPMFTKPPYGGALSLPDRGALLLDPLLAAPGTYRVPPVIESKTFSGKDFRPRGPSVFDADPRVGSADESLAFDKTIWQRLGDYRNHDRIRVLTLWESGASAVSIQTNHRGDPSLQWTSRLMNRGGATHGLLDHLFPVKPFSGDSAIHVTRSANPQSGRSGSVLGGMHLGGSTPPP